MIVLHQFISLESGRKGDVVEVATYQSMLASAGVGGMSKWRRLDGDSLLFGVDSFVYGI